jgi:DNA invertase Pin-like site-specific DNA recombinase
MKYGYVRVSTKGQQRDGNSLPEQETAILERYADAIIVTEAKSGAEERPVFEELVEKMVEGDLLIVTKLDRFSRSTIDGLQFIDKLMSKGVSVHVLNYGLVENTPVGRMILTNLFAYAEFERGMIIERTKAGKKQKQKTDPNYKEGRKTIEVPDFEKYYEKNKKGEISVVDCCAMLGINRAKWYRLCKEN